MLAETVSTVFTSSNSNLPLFGSSNELVFVGFPQAFDPVQKSRAQGHPHSKPSVFPLVVMIVPITLLACLALMIEGAA